MVLQAIHLFPNSLDILTEPLQILSVLSTASTLAQLAQLALFILQQRECFLLNENPIRSAIMPRPVPSRLGSFIGGIQLRLQLCQLAAQSYLLPLLVLDRVAEIRSLRLV